MAYMHGKCPNMQMSHNQKRCSKCGTAGHVRATARTLQKQQEGRCLFELLVTFTVLLGLVISSQ